MMTRHVERAEKNKRATAQKQLNELERVFGARNMAGIRCHDELAYHEQDEEFTHQRADPTDAHAERRAAAALRSTCVCLWPNGIGKV